MSTEKRMIIAIAVSFVVIVVWSLFLAPPPPPKSATPTTVTEESAQAPTQTAAAEPAAQEEKSGETIPDITAEPETDTVATEEQTVVVESPLYRVELTNRGGGSALSWQLKKYEASFSKDVLDLVAPKELVGDEYLPYSTLIRTGDGKYENLPALPVLQAESAGGKVDFKDGAARVTFTYRQENYGVVIKEFLFHPDSYIVDVNLRAELKKGGGAIERQAVMLFGPGLGQLLRYKDGGIVESSNENDGYIWRKSGEAASHVPSLVHEVGKPADGAPVFTESTINEFLIWAGVENNYFLNLAFSDQAGGFIPSYQLQRTVMQKTATAEKYFSFPYLAVKPLKDNAGFSLYVGPKDLQILETAANGRLKDVVTFGWFGFVSRPGLWALEQIYGFTHNYGVAIILLTLLISVALLPLIIKQRSSMASMQKIQPQIKAIQNKYKAERGDDIKTRQDKKAALNEELMALYKVEGVNPMGGCLPLLIQLPILMAFFDMIRVAIGLRKAPFLLWWDNLALADPTFILPILMGAAMYFSQKLTPAPADSQTGALKFLPFIFIFLFASAPSGLVLYWLTSSLFNLATQFFLSKSVAPAPVASKATAVQKKGHKK